MVLFKIDEDSYKFDKVSVVFCLKTSRLSFVLKNVCLPDAFLKMCLFVG